MTREEAKKELSKLIFELGFEDNVDDKVYALNMAIQALSQEQDMTIAYLMGKYEDKEPCDDAISRQDAIDAIYEHEFSNWCDKDEVSTILNDLPSVTQKSGKCKNCKW